MKMRELSRDHLITPERDEWAGIESHFFKEFVASTRARFAPSVLKLGIPNRM